MFAFPADVLEEGADAAMDRMAATGMAGVSLAAIYHDGRDVLPHNPRVRVKFQEDGAAFFSPAAGAFPESGIQPIRSASGPGAFERAATAARKRGLSVIAWTVFLHNTSLGRRYPDAVTRNVYGDPQFTSLCPANPATVAYSLGVAASIAALGVDAVNAEGLHYLPLEHGYHHERYFLRIGPIDRLLLGLCFCVHCIEAAASRGVDVSALERAARARLDRVLETAESFDGSDDAPQTVDGMWGGELGGFLRSRERTVSDLTQQVHEVLRERSTAFVFNDPAGALRRAGAAEADESWRLGIDPATIGGTCDEVQMLAYSESPATVADDVAAYQVRVGAATPLRVAVRPTWPDCDSIGNLADKLRRLRAAGAAAADFYAYDFMRLEELDRVAAAVNDSGWATAPPTASTDPSKASPL